MSEKVINMEKNVVDVSDLGVLSSSLREREAAATGLCERAEALLNQSGQETTVDGVAAMMTQDMCEVTLDDKSLYARLGRRIRPDGTSVDLPAIVFCAGQDLKDIHTSNGYFSALIFWGGTLEGTHLVAGGGTLDDPVSDHPEHIKLAKQIIDTISTKSMKRREEENQTREQQQLADEQTAAAEKAAAANAIQEARQLKDRRRQERQETVKKTTGKVAAVALIGSALWYNSIHSAIAGDKIDAKIGPVPMPAPIEWLVDWNNRSDHVAQGFKKPAGALPIRLGQGPTTIPILANYDTNGDMDASFNGFNGYKDDESKPGLYSSDFDSTYIYHPSDGDGGSNDGSAYFGEDGKRCYDIKGDYQDGVTSVFSQTVGINKMIRLSVPNTTTMKVCEAPDAPKHFKGSIYVYRKP